MSIFKYSTLFILFSVFNSIVLAGISLPENISSGLARGIISESGGFWVEGIDENQFHDYIKQHWREIADNLESLPPASAEAESMHDLELAKEATKANFGVACEVLPALEYMDFLDKWADLWEAKQISFMTFERTLSLWSDKKRDFLAVNWEHPRVKSLIDRAISLTPDSPENKDFIEFMGRIRTGKLADNYMTNVGDNAPFPETLPGIKLKRPAWSKLSKEASRRWDDYDAQWKANKERIQRREVPVPRGYFEPEVSRRWPWMLVLISIFVTAAIWLWRKKFRRI